MPRSATLKRCLLSASPPSRYLGHLYRRRPGIFLEPAPDGWARELSDPPSRPRAELDGRMVGYAKLPVRPFVEPRGEAAEPASFMS